MELFSDFVGPGGGGAFLSRYLHILFGIAWIGLLYFFNFVQVPAYAQLSDGARSEALRNVTWRALWWFRWAALCTFLTGLLLLIFQEQLKSDYTTDAAGEAVSYFATTQGMAISVGMLFGITMFLNVWGVIWRNQKIVIGSARSVAEGGEADPGAPAAAKKAARASRANTFFSFTMLWFMVLTAHFSGGFELVPDGSAKGMFWAFIVILWAVVEASALGFIGGIDGPINKLFFDDHRKTLLYGFIYLAVIYVVGFELIIGGA
jgi:uncharacterized membrane protein